MLLTVNQHAEDIAIVEMTTIKNATDVREWDRAALPIDHPLDVCGDCRSQVNKKKFTKEAYSASTPKITPASTFVLQPAILKTCILQSFIRLQVTS